MLWHVTQLEDLGINSQSEAVGLLHAGKFIRVHRKKPCRLLLQVLIDGAVA